MGGLRKPFNGFPPRSLIYLQFLHRTHIIDGFLALWQEIWPQKLHPMYPWLITVIRCDIPKYPNPENLRRNFRHSFLQCSIKIWLFIYRRWLGGPFKMLHPHHGWLVEKKMGHSNKNLGSRKPVFNRTNQNASFRDCPLTCFALFHPMHSFACCLSNDQHVFLYALLCQSGRGIPFKAMWAFHTRQMFDGAFTRQPADDDTMSVVSGRPKSSGHCLRPREVSFRISM